jgi:hypothetical protein
VLIDDPDLLFGEVKDLVNIIGGLLLASVNITSMSTTEKEARIKVCTFLKQHKYDMLSRKFEDFDHISQNAFTLSWKSEELDELIVKRIRFREKLAPKVSALESWARAFEVETEAALNDLKGYLYPKLRNGPRDLITFCNLAMQAARARGNAHISKDVLIDVEGSYSEECLNEVEREFGDRYPSIVLVVRKLFEHPKLKTKGDIRRKALEDALSERYRDEELQSLKKDFPWLAGTTGRNLVEVLFKVGVIGFMSKQRSGVPVMSYSSASVDDSVHNATTFFVHPAYQQALRIGDTQ